ncbi:hypothetical protein [Niallia sp. FSL W8-0635]|uniref:hypothetical protein n=1 Tax=Niallia sp. FSL W8-0635 TaxID=2975337 RepID=UPI0030F6CBD1
MKMTLKRSGGVKSFEAILTMEWFSPDRPDIVELLAFLKENGGLASVDKLKTMMGNVPDFVAEGVINHLKSTGFIHPHGLISTKGNKVVETGKVPIEEKGQYKFYYIEDSLLENYLLHFERSSKIMNDKTAYIDVKLFQEKKYDSVINSHRFQIKGFDGQSKMAYIEEDSGKYQLEWEIDLSRENPSRMFLSGELGKRNNGRTQKFPNKEIVAKTYIDPYQFISLIIQKVKKKEMEWNEGKRILLVPFDMVTEEELSTLTTSLKVPDWGEAGRFGGFGASEINMIPIGPLNAVEAKKWVIALAKTFLQEGYKNQTELYSFLEGLKAETAFSSYEYVFDGITISDILDEVRHKEDYQAFWNLQAPIDLFLELDDKFIVRNKRLDLAAGMQFSMLELIDELVGYEVPDTLVFSSKFVQNPAQVRKFELFVKAFKAKGVKNVLLVTKHGVSFQDKEIKVESYDNVYVGSIPPHDRYFAFKANGNWHRYKMTAELDQCRFERIFDANEHTRGSWQDISFMEILPEVFPQKLNEQLSMMEEVYYL